MKKYVYINNKYEFYVKNKQYSSNINDAKIFNQYVYLIVIDHNTSSKSLTSLDIKRVEYFEIIKKIRKFKLEKIKQTND